MSRKHATFTIILVIALAIGGMSTTLGASGPDRVESSGASASTQATQTENETTVTFEDQTSNGSTVTVAEVTLDGGGFVAVHDEELLNGSVLDSVVGVSDYLEAGTHENVTVELDQPVEESQTLLAVAYRDTNGDEEFDFVESNGDQDGAYTVENQVVVDAATVTIEQVPEETPEETTTTPEETPEETEIETTPEGTPEETEITETPEETDVEETPEETTTPPEETTTPVETTTPEETEMEETTEETEVETTPEETPEETEIETTPEEPTDEVESLLVSEFDAPDELELDDERLTVSATVTNPGDRTINESVELRVGGTVVERRQVEVEPGESERVKFKVDTASLDVEPGESFVEVLTRDFGQVERVTVEEADDSEPSD